MNYVENYNSCFSNNSNKIPNEIKLCVWKRDSLISNNILTISLCFCCNIWIKIPQCVKKILQIKITNKKINNFPVGCFGFIDLSLHQINTLQNIKMICRKCRTRQKKKKKKLTECIKKIIDRDIYMLDYSYLIENLHIEYKI